MLKQYLYQICDAFTDGICISDANGIALLVNKKHAEITGVAPKDIVGKGVTSFVEEGIFDIVLNPIILKEKKSATCVQNLSTGKKIVLTGHPIFDEAGHVCYVITFIRDITVLSHMKDEIENQRELLGTFQELTKKHGKDAPLVVKSPAMRALFVEVDKVADTDATVLLLGETGVGKDVIARQIHARSKRSEEAFIKIDCGAIPENLIETELFGYVGGTFSGASKQGKIGLIEAAGGGTIFFDEIGELPLLMQSRLLRVLQDKEVMRVGATRANAIQARIIAATNRDLQRAVKQKAFRSDLYYRLKVAVLSIPPLRERKEDILPMAQTFLEHFCHKYRRSMSLSEKAEAILQEYGWPGNIRELQNIIQRLVIMGKGRTVEAKDLPIEKVKSQTTDSLSVNLNGIDITGKTLKDLVHDFECAVIQAGVAKYGNVDEAARQFGVNRSTLFRKLKTT